MDTKEAITRCAQNPNNIWQLEPYIFERVVGELLAGFGWKVSITPQSRDGGYDILGITTDLSGLQNSWLVECKRYTPGKKVGIEIARQIIGVKTHIGVPNAVLVTSSKFTDPVRELSSARHDLHLVDFETLTAWLQGYSPTADVSYAAERAFSSCFISHSSKDAEFAEKLAGHLRRRNVPIWYAPEDILPGERIYDQVKKAINTFDRLLVVISHNSMKSDWVRTELASALNREKKEHTQVLFPVSLVPIEEIREWECIDPDTGIDISRELRSYYIPDFSDWRTTSSFDRELGKIVKVLQGNRSNDYDSNRVSLLRQQARSESIREREIAVRQLGQLGPAAASAVPTLQKSLKDPSMYVRNAAAWALAEIGTDEAQKALQKFEDR